MINVIKNSFLGYLAHSKKTLFDRNTQVGGTNPICPSIEYARVPGNETDTNLKAATEAVLDARKEDIGETEYNYFKTAIEILNKGTLADEFQDIFNGLICVNGSSWSSSGSNSTKVVLSFFDPKEAFCDFNYCYEKDESDSKEGNNTALDCPTTILPANISDVKKCFGSWDLPNEIDLYNQTLELIKLEFLKYEWDVNSNTDDINNDFYLTTLNNLLPLKTGASADEYVKAFGPLLCRSSDPYYNEIFNTYYNLQFVTACAILKMLDQDICSSNCTDRSNNFNHSSNSSNISKTGDILDESGTEKDHFSTLNIILSSSIAFAVGSICVIAALVCYRRNREHSHQLLSSNSLIKEIDGDIELQTI